MPADPLAAERVEVETPSAHAASDLHQRLAEGMAARQLIGAEGEHQAHRTSHGARERDREVLGGPVGPVHVLQHQHQRRLLAELADDQAQVLDHRATPAGSAVLEEGRHPLCHGRQRVRGSVDNNAAQGLAHRLERDPGVEVEAVTGQHGEPLLPGMVADVGDQRGLADAGIAADEHGLGDTRRDRRQHLVGLVELAVASEQAARWGLHAASYAAAIRVEAGTIQCRRADGPARRAATRVSWSWFTVDS